MLLRRKKLISNFYPTIKKFINNKIYYIDMMIEEMKPPIKDAEG